MSALSYFLEREGIVTTGISLVRENSESMRPPRALWVTFPLGRPLGKPGDPDFQRDVITAALDLLNRDQGPVLEDYPHDVPALETEAVAACPVSFPKTDQDDASWVSRLSKEFETLAPWYDIACRRRNGRTLVGISEYSLIDNIKRLGQHLDDAEMPTDLSWLKPAIEDLKAYYSESMTAQPGDYDFAAIQKQFWQDTELGAAILDVYHQFQNSDDGSLKIFARILAPREALGESTGEGEVRL